MEVLPSGAVPPDLRNAPAPPRRWLLLALLTVAYGMGAFGILGVSPLLPSLVEGFRLTRLDVAFVVPSVYLGGLLFSLPAGHLADRWGVRPTLLGGLAVGAAGLALAAAAPQRAWGWPRRATGGWVGAGRRGLCFPP